MSEVKVTITVDRIEGENAVLLLPKTGGELSGSLAGVTTSRGE